MTIEITTSASADQSVASIRTREVSDVGPMGRNQTRISLARVGWGLHPVSEATDGFDEVDAELLAKPAHENLDRVGIAVEILIIHMLHQLRAGDDLTHVMHQIG